MSRRYEVEVNAGARHQLHRLPPRVAPAIVEFLTTTLLDDPLRLSKPLTGKLEGFRSARRGDYRVVCWIDEDRVAVVVVRIAHRADVYRPRLG